MLRFTSDHEWVRLEGAIATVGISDYAQSSLGDITFVELPTQGKSLKKGDIMGVVESVKAASDIFAPVTGIVKSVNLALEMSPELVNDNAESDGWLCVLEGVDPAELEGLMTAEEYAAFVNG